jgi:hypothetical protein
MDENRLIRRYGTPLHSGTVSAGEQVYKMPTLQQLESVARNVRECIGDFATTLETLAQLVLLLRSGK